MPINHDLIYFAKATLWIRCYIWDRRCPSLGEMTFTAKLDRNKRQAVDFFSLSKWKSNQTRHAWHDTSTSRTTCFRKQCVWTTMTGQTFALALMSPGINNLVPRAIRSSSQTPWHNPHLTPHQKEKKKKLECHLSLNVFLSLSDRARA